MDFRGCGAQSKDNKLVVVLPIFLLTLCKTLERLAADECRYERLPKEPSDLKSQKLAFEAPLEIRHRTQARFVTKDLPCPKVSFYRSVRTPEY